MARTTQILLLSHFAIILLSHLAPLVNAQETEIFRSNVNDATEELNANNGAGGVVFDAYSQCAFGNCAQITGSAGDDVFLQTKLGYINCTGYTNLKIQYDLYPSRLRQNSYLYVYVWTSSDIANKEEITMYTNSNTAENSLLVNEEFELDSSYDETDNLRIRWAIETQEQSETSSVYIDGIKVFGTAVPTSSPTKSPTNAPILPNYDPTIDPTAAPSVAPTTHTTDPTPYPFTTAHPTLPTATPTDSTISPTTTVIANTNSGTTTTETVEDPADPQSESAVTLYIFIIGLLLGILITIVVIFFFFRRRQNQKIIYEIGAVQSPQSQSGDMTANTKPSGHKGGKVRLDSLSSDGGGQDERSHVAPFGAAQNGSSEQRHLNQVHPEPNKDDKVFDNEVEGVVVLDENNLTVMAESPSSDHETTQGIVANDKPNNGMHGQSPLTEEEKLELEEVKREESQGSEEMYDQENKQDIDTQTTGQVPIMFDNSSEALYRKGVESPTDGSHATIGGISSPTVGSPTSGSATAETPNV